MRYWDLIGDIQYWILKILTFFFLERNHSATVVASLQDLNVYVKIEKYS